MQCPKRISVISVVKTGSVFYTDAAINISMAFFKR
jgi:hypothetical protein